MITAEWTPPNEVLRSIEGVRLCVLPGCGRKHVALGLCRRHWLRLKRNGHPLIGRDLDRPVQPGYAKKPCSICGNPKPRGIGRKFCVPCAEANAAASEERKALKDRERDLVDKYGITLADYQDLVERQGGVCAICGNIQTKSYRWFDVDHDHETGRVRGLLCRRCNTGLGYIEAGFHLRAVPYLERGDSVDYR